MPGDGDDDARFSEVAGRSPPVEALWRQDAGAALTPIIPGDGCVDLVVRAHARGVITSAIVPASARAHQAFIGENEEVLGVRLRLGWGGPLLARAELVAAEATARAGATGLGSSMLDALVGEVLDGATPPAIVQEFLQFTRECSGAAHLGRAFPTEADERRLQRAAKAWIGISPKAVLRLERARAARTALREGTPIAEVAVEFGYADQSHLTREFREILGVTPRAVQPVGILQDQRRRGR